MNVIAAQYRKKAYLIKHPGANLRSEKVTDTGIDAINRRMGRSLTSRSCFNLSLQELREFAAKPQYDPDRCRSIRR